MLSVCSTLEEPESRLSLITLNSLEIAGLENPVIFHLKKASKFTFFEDRCQALEICNFLSLRLLA